MKTAVSMSTTTRSPGLTILRPLARARIFSVIVMPIVVSRGVLGHSIARLEAPCIHCFVRVLVLQKTGMTRETTANPYTAGMGEFVAGLVHDRIPGEVKERIKLLILDALCCAIFGVDLEWSRILVTALAELDSSKACGVWGTDRRLSGPHAALANGTLVQSFELDDVHREGVLHVGAVTLPPLFALAELRPRMSGREFLTAAVAGYEIGPRVGQCMGQEHILQGWHSGATLGVFSAAVRT